MMISWKRSDDETKTAARVTQAAAVHIRLRSATQCPDRNAPPPGVGMSIIIRGIWRLITSASFEVFERL
jgi:hypothetical protein